MELYVVTSRATFNQSHPLSSPAMASTNATGLFSVCASGNVSIQVTCTGPSCASLEEIPGVTCANDTTSFKCSNSVVCNGASNLTSSFSMQQLNLTVSQTQNISIGDQQFILTSTGSNFTAPSAQSAAISWQFSRGNLLPKLLMCIFVMMLATQTAAQSPFNAVMSQFSEALGPLLDPLEHLVCNKAVGEAISGATEKARNNLEIELLEDCLNLVVDALLVDGAELVVATGGVAEAVGGAVIGETLPITIPSKLFAAMVTNGALCLSLIHAIFDALIDTAAGDVCDALISSQMPNTTQPPPTVISSSVSSASSAATTSSTNGPGPTSSSIPPDPIPTDFPSAAALASDPCVAAQLSVYYTGVQGLAQTCADSNPTGGAWDMSTIFCDPSIKPRYSTLCTEFCNSPCGSYDLQTLITDAGPAFNPSSTLATISEACPGFLGTGRCTSQAPSCTCGVGASTCVASAVGCAPAKI